MERAVVIGASAAGLLAAQMLSRHAKEVVLFERDAVPRDATARRGVPQGHHIHGLLTRGQRSIERYFPGLRDEWIVDGATIADGNRHVGWLSPYGFRPRIEGVGMQYVGATRPFLDAGMSRRVRGNSRVVVRDETSVVGLVADRTTHVRGVRLESGEAVDADLVIDATGRGSRLPKFLSEIGAATPPETVVDAGVGYASALVRLHRPMPNGWRSLFSLATPTVPRGAAVMTVEGGRTIVTLLAPGGLPLPKTSDEVDEFTRGLRCPAVNELLAEADWLTPIVHNRSTSSRRRHYERVALPVGVLPIGDSVCAFNPVYGQGITVAGLEVEALDARLASSVPLASLAADVLDEFSRIVDAVWAVTSIEDFRFAGTTGPRPFGLRLIHAYVDRLLVAAGAADPEIIRAWDLAINLEDLGESLRTPSVIWKALRTRVPRDPLDRVPLPAWDETGVAPASAIGLPAQSGELR